MTLADTDGRALPRRALVDGLGQTLGELELVTGSTASNADDATYTKRDLCQIALLAHDGTRRPAELAACIRDHHLSPDSGGPDGDSDERLPRGFPGLYNAIRLTGDPAKTAAARDAFASIGLPVEPEPAETEHEKRGWIAMKVRWEAHLTVSETYPRSREHNILRAGMAALPMHNPPENFRRFLRTHRLAADDGTWLSSPLPRHFEFPGILACAAIGGHPEKIRAVIEESEAMGRPARPETLESAARYAADAKSAEGLKTVLEYANAGPPSPIERLARARHEATERFAPVHPTSRA